MKRRNRNLIALALLALLALQILTSLAGCSGSEKSKNLPTFEGIPTAVVEAASDYVKTVFDQYQNSLSADAGYKLLDWRIDNVTYCTKYENFEGMTLDIYSFNYKYQADKIENVVLAGGRYAVEDGWFCPDYDGSSFLIFEGEKYICFVGNNDGGPEDHYNPSNPGIFDYELGKALYATGLINLDYPRKWYDDRLVRYSSDLDRYIQATADLRAQLEEVTTENGALKQQLAALQTEIAALKSNAK